jgi:hypothetical protein
MPSPFILWRCGMGPPPSLAEALTAIGRWRRGDGRTVAEIWRDERLVRRLADELPVDAGATEAVRTNGGAGAVAAPKAKRAPRAKPQGRKPPRPERRSILDVWPIDLEPAAINLDEPQPIDLNPKPFDRKPKPIDFELSGAPDALRPGFVGVGAALRRAAERR